MTDIGSQIGGPTDPAGPHAPFPPAAWASPQTSTNAVVALACAVASWVALPLVAAVVAVVLARNATEEIAVSGGRVTGAGLANAARVVGWANIIVSLVVLVSAIVVLLIMGALL